ncbi:hypothetical protein R3Q06_32265 [Rhodococcus erythropolis]|uniref:hypothetical protein n=1 Tax=Rhodococcus erythropolis TaxID=1833 RepID=UPI00294A991E|nr:hypothetical protein [Rhodococcus erythropolis]MDV6278148.1 hypothetical protein [Rhodococcus erythropolis]
MAIAVGTACTHSRRGTVVKRQEGDEVGSFTGRLAPRQEGHGSTDSDIRRDADTDVQVCYNNKSYSGVARYTTGREWNDIYIVSGYDAGGRAVLSFTHAGGKAQSPLRDDNRSC